MKRRCLIPVDGFYEWKKVLGGKIPYTISMKDDSPIVFAGLWKGWKQGWPISARVNTSKNDGSEIIAPVELESVARPEDFPQLL